jgi:hypothetical protein
MKGNILNYKQAQVTLSLNLPLDLEFEILLPVLKVDFLLLL